MRAAVACMAGTRGCCSVSCLQAMEQIVLSCVQQAWLSARTYWCWHHRCSAQCSQQICSRTSRHTICRLFFQATGLTKYCILLHKGGRCRYMSVDCCAEFSRCSLEDDVLWRTVFAWCYPPRSSEPAAKAFHRSFARYSSKDGPRSFHGPRGSCS